MPEILTMIQIKRLTPAPGVLIMALLSLLYLMSSDIYALINYVGFATWVSCGLFDHSCRIETNCTIILVEHRSIGPLRSMVALGTAEPPPAHQSEPDLPHFLLVGHPLRDHRTNDRQPCGDRHWNSDDHVEYPRVSGVYRLEKQAQVVPKSNE